MRLRHRARRRIHRRPLVSIGHCQVFQRFSRTQGVETMADEASIDYSQGSATAFAGFTDSFAPVARAIVDRLPELAPRSQVLDLACGPGQPGLSVLERHPEVELLGVDTSQ